MMSDTIVKEILNANNWAQLWKRSRTIASLDAHQAFITNQILNHISIVFTRFQLFSVLIQSCLIKLLVSHRIWTICFSRYHVPTPKKFYQCIWSEVVTEEWVLRHFWAWCDGMMLMWKVVRDLAENYFCSDECTSTISTEGLIIWGMN